MQFIETRGNDGHRPASVSFSQAILEPMASFGGLYVPERLPALGLPFLEAHRNSDYKTLARAVLEAYAIDIEPAVIDEALARYDGFDDPAQPVPVVQVDNELFVAELYHGPTRAFKDMALQPFGVVLSRLAQARGEHYLILAATSGDTGPATLETFKGQANVKVACLYPDGGTSDVQRLQMVTEDAANLKVIGIHGDFDDAQTALKSLLSSAHFQQALAERETHLSAANSVNFGRIVFQQIYHLHSYLELVRQGRIAIGDKVYLNVPSGNFGNALGGYYAMKMGLPVEKILISSNANNVLTDWINTGCYDLRGRDVIATSSPAMDILKSSNVERVLFDLFGAQRTRELMQALDAEGFYQLSEEETARLQAIFAADHASDQEVETAIRDTFEQHGYLMDPHTATCLKAHRNGRDQALPDIVYSTAEWTKFSPTIALALVDKDHDRSQNLREKILAYNEIAHLSSHGEDQDKPYLDFISELIGLPIPPVIAALFERAVAQPTVIDKVDIEAEILAFL